MSVKAFETEQSEVGVRGDDVIRGVGAAITRPRDSQVTCRPNFQPVQAAPVVTIDAEVTLEREEEPLVLRRSDQPTALLSRRVEASTFVCPIVRTGDVLCGGICPNLTTTRSCTE